MSRMLVALPVRVTVYWVFAARLTAGFWIHWFVVPVLTTTPTAVPVDVAFRLNEAPFTPCTASLKVASMLAVRLTPVAPANGVRAVTVGAEVSAPVVKVQLTVASGLFAASRIAVAPPVRVTRYWVFAARSAVGLRVHWLVVPTCVTVPARGAEVVAADASRVAKLPVTP